MPTKTIGQNTSQLNDIASFQDLQQMDTSEQFKESFLTLIIQNSKSHPDISMREFYLALSYHLGNNTKKSVTEFGKSIIVSLANRSDGTDIKLDHAVNLVARAAQYVWIEYHRVIIEFAELEKAPSLRGIADLTISDWQKIFELLSTPHFDSNVDELQQLFLTTLNTRSTQTTRVERYKSVLLAKELLFNKDDKIKILDVGASIGAGLVSLVSPNSFTWDGIEYTSRDNLGEKYMAPIKIDKAVAMDVDIPDTKWVLACMHYFSKLGEYHEKELFLNQVSQKTVKYGIKIENQDLFNLHKRSDLHSNFDIVSVLTTLYQIQPKYITDAVQNLCKTVRPGGIIVIADFMVDKYNSLMHVDNWFGKPYPYKVYVIKIGPKGVPVKKNNGSIYWHLGSWDNGRCTVFKNGDDFDTLRLSSN